jgi:ribosomal-protein-alanine N-acetyltransferase
MAPTLLARWPILKALRNCIRRILPMDSERSKLTMPVLETQRLVLRKFEPNDLREIIAWEEAAGGQNRSIEAREFLDYCFREYHERGIGPWALQWKETGAIVGNSGFPHIDFKKLSGEVNYYVASRDRGQGLAPEALKALLRFGFDDIGLTRIQARCEPDNLGSERVMQKVGMKFEGLLDEDPFSNDPSPKQKLYAILRQDFNRIAHSQNNSAMNLTAQSDDRS